MAGGGGGTFRLTFSLHKEDSSAKQQQQQKASVYCKMDGQRFTQQKTVKLLADCKYRIDISVRPASKTVKAFLLMERTLELMDKSAKEGDPISSSDGGGGSNGEASVYSSHFVMDFLTPTKKGQRECLPLIVKLNGGYDFRTSLQIKVYKANSTQHCDWGTPIHSIEYECAIDQQTNSIKIVKETFR